MAGNSGGGDAKRLEESFPDLDLLFYASVKL